MLYIHLADDKCVTQAACETRHAHCVAVAAAVLWSCQHPLLGSAREQPGSPLTARLQAGHHQRSTRSLEQLDHELPLLFFLEKGIYFNIPASA